MFIEVPILLEERDSELEKLGLETEREHMFINTCIEAESIRYFFPDNDNNTKIHFSNEDFLICNVPYTEFKDLMHRLIGEIQ